MFKATDAVKASYRLLDPDGQDPGTNCSARVAFRRRAHAIAQVAGEQPKPPAATPPTTYTPPTHDTSRLAAEMERIRIEQRIQQDRAPAERTVIGMVLGAIGLRMGDRRDS